MYESWKSCRGMMISSEMLTSEWGIVASLLYELSNKCWNSRRSLRDTHLRMQQCMRRLRPIDASSTIDVCLCARLCVERHCVPHREHVATRCLPAPAPECGPGGRRGGRLREGSSGVPAGRGRRGGGGASGFLLKSRSRYVAVESTGLEAGREDTGFDSNHWRFDQRIFNLNQIKPIASYLEEHVKLSGTDVVIAQPTRQSLTTSNPQLASVET
ncbi:hypothetical protein EVAR_39967_1 [Eumeta japonica]|uniref:Uncharacterized protein n=1 Tax=Eumeta variegata TaxID=151549 RepID=A0A4C1X4V5_EUMVA|nr:hypothetical protein EVAR_39967_1 [Eumeta japonica]